jgi:7-cyano-7-deazaguanine synthase
MKKHAVLSLSGGMDSTSLLLHLLANDYAVTALSFDYGQKHHYELDCAKTVANYLTYKNFPVRHETVSLNIGSLLNSALIMGGTDVPEGHYEQENMKETVVPNRNKIFSSIIQAVALSIATKNNCTVDIAMGIHAGDHAIYPDCRQEFRDADFAAFTLGNWDADKVKVSTPYLYDNKFSILCDAEQSCKKLGVDFDFIFSNTNTSYKPVMHNDVWYSDYKSASSVERIEAFIRLGRPDPVNYADETGPVSWEVAAKHVENIIFHHTR